MLAREQTSRVVTKCLNPAISFRCPVHYCFGVSPVSVVFIYTRSLSVIFVNLRATLITIISATCENLSSEIEKNNIYTSHPCNIGRGNIFIYLTYRENKLNIS